MACLQVENGGGGLLIRRVAVNILNKQSWTAGVDGPPTWGLDKGLITPHHKTTKLLHIMNMSLRPGQILWHNPSIEKWI
jgi:hypothetical protein